VVARLDLGFVQDAIRQARLGPGARVVVVDGAGVPVARSDAATGAPTSLAGRDPAVDAALASSVEGTLTADGWVSAYRNLSSYQSVRGVRWAIVHQQPVDEAYALARRATRDLLIIGGAALALALTLGFFFASRLTGPLAALARRADAIAAGIAAPHGGGAAEVVIADLGPPVTGPGEIGVLASRLDEMARRIAERSELATALARGDRLASVGVMSAQVAHEINNPLTTVLGYAQLLLEDKPADHPDRAALELIAEEAQRMKGIVGGMLDYARTPRDDDARRADPAQVLGHVAALLEPQLRRARATLRTELTTTAAIAIEGHALQQVLVNLVQNALQAQDGVVVTVRARPAPGGLATQLVVADDGPGIPAADRARVFDPFFTTKAAGVGTGLGLAVCRHLVATAGGTIEVGAGPDGRGAEFRLVIPNAS
jgi:signal transduction histidine kinase